MMTMDSAKQQEVELVMLEQLVKEEHLLRKINKYIDFKFIYDLVKDLYSNSNGRPSIDPIVLFKMWLIMKLYGIRSERRLMEEIHHNMAYRWFLGFSITTKVPHHSIFSQNKIRRFKESDIFEAIFIKIVHQAKKHGLVKGKILYTDSTHIRANASNSKYENEEIEIIVDPNKDLERINKIRERHGKKPLQEKDTKVIVKNKKVSTVDPDSGFMHRDRKPLGFHHLSHVSVDSSYNIILDAYVTPGNVHDSTPYVERIDYIASTFNLEDTLKYVCADTGYFTPKVLKGLKEQHYTPVIGSPRERKKVGKDSKYWFTFDIIEDVYVCKQGQLLEYKTTTRQGYSEYVSNPEVCAVCEKRGKCLYDNADYRTIRRHIDEELKEDAKLFLKTEKGKAIYTRRKETVERVFADEKELHQLRYAHYRGRENVQSEVYLVAIAQNIKKISMVLDSLGVV